MSTADNINQSLDSRRIVRDQESRIAASAAIGFNVAKPFIQFQSAMLRLLGEQCEVVAQNYEKTIEAFSNVIEPRLDRGQHSHSQ